MAGLIPLLLVIVGAAMLLAGIAVRVMSIKTWIRLRRRFGRGR